MAARDLFRRPVVWIVGGVVLAVLLVAVVAPFVYINFIREDAPEELTLDDAAGPTTTADGATTSSADGLDGTWSVSGGEAGYRAAEILFGQDAEAAGRTEDVTGSLTISGTTVEAADIIVDMTTIASDEERRDGQFHGRIMETGTFPEATFTLTEPIELDEVPPAGEEVTVSATGDFTIHGVTNSVTFDLVARRSGDTIETSAQIPVRFSDYEIDDPSGGPATVGDEGTIEFALAFTRT
jgi:polyisoprenoid-binding protein YceI